MKDHSKSRLPAGQTWEPLNPVNDGMVQVGEAGQIVDINAEALRLMRCRSQSPAGRDFWDLVPQEIADQYQNATEKALASSAQHAFVAHHKFENCWLEYSFRRRIPGYIVRLRDVSSTHKLQRLLEDSERFNALIFEVNPNAMWIFDTASLRILAVNRASIEFYGIAHKKFMTLRMGALFPDGEGSSLLSALGPGNKPDDTQLELQLCKQKKGDGQLVLVELACGRISWNDHEAVLVSLADVTDRHLADRALRRESAALEQEVERLKGDLKNTRRDLTAFTHALSHDLQGPLHAVSGFATRLGDKYSAVLAESGQHYLDRIQAGTRQMARLVDDLRVLVQLPPLSRVPERLDLVALCRTLIDDLRRRDPSDRIVTVEMEASLPLMADKALVRTALACLLDNAWKFTSKKQEGWIKVALLPGKTPAELVLQVSDNGAGFDAAYSDRLFTPFQRLHSSADFPGNGLGLGIVKRVAERHGGRVWAKTDQTGTSFFMAFPQGGASALPVRPD